LNGSGRAYPKFIRGTFPAIAGGMRLAARPVRERPEVAVLNISRMKHSGNTIVVFCIERAGRSRRLSCSTQGYWVNVFANWSRQQPQSMISHRIVTCYAS
jgi:hypothetical protein